MERHYENIKFLDIAFFLLIKLRRGLFHELASDNWKSETHRSTYNAIIPNFRVIKGHKSYGNVQTRPFSNSIEILLVEAHVFNLN